MEPVGFWMSWCVGPVGSSFPGMRRRSASARTGRPGAAREGFGKGDQQLECAAGDYEGMPSVVRER